MNYNSIKKLLSRTTRLAYRNKIDLSRRYHPSFSNKKYHNKSEDYHDTLKEDHEDDQFLAPHTGVLNKNIFPLQMIKLLLREGENAFLKKRNK